MGLPLPQCADPYLAYLLERQPASLAAALVLFDETSKGLDQSSPHLVTWDWLRRHLGWNPHRRRLLASFRNFGAQVRRFGVVPQGALIGGSFVSPAARPKDIDFLLIYTARPDFRAADFAAFAADRHDGLDFRVVPSDAGIITLLKSAIFHHLLFEGRKGGEGSLLLAL